MLEPCPTHHRRRQPSFPWSPPRCSSPRPVAPPARGLIRARR